jgi:hypothetical protein
MCTTCSDAIARPPFTEGQRAAAKYVMVQQGFRDIDSGECEYEIGVLARAFAERDRAAELRGAKQERFEISYKLQKDADQRWLDGFQELSDELRNQTAAIRARRP